MAAGKAGKPGLGLLAIGAAIVGAIIFINGYLASRRYRRRMAGEGMRRVFAEPMPPIAAAARRSAVTLALSVVGASMVALAGRLSLNVLSVVLTAAGLIVWIGAEFRLYEAARSNQAIDSEPNAQEHH